MVANPAQQNDLASRLKYTYKTFSLHRCYGDGTANFMKTTFFKSKIGEAFFVDIKILADNF